MSCDINIDDEIMPDWQIGLRDILMVTAILAGVFLTIAVFDSNGVCLGLGIIFAILANMIVRIAIIGDPIDGDLSPLSPGVTS